MTKTIGYLGIDAAKTFHVVCVKDANKRSLIPSLTMITRDMSVYGSVWMR